MSTLFEQVLCEVSVMFDVCIQCQIDIVHDKNESEVCY